jgi:hypothetical protein
MKKSSFQVVEVFEITGRGLVAAFDELIEFVPSKQIMVIITRPDGTTIETQAFVEILLRRQPVVIEKSALLLKDLNRADVPIGSSVEMV